MKILFGVQATGNGHISRSRLIVKYLKQMGNEVVTIFSGRENGLLKELEDFEPFDVFKGLTFCCSSGKVQYAKTALQLDLINFYRDINHYEAKGFDLAIIDFEPIAARIAKKNRIPCIGIGHQYSFLYNIPVAGMTPLAKWILRHFAPADIHIGLHWHHFNAPILPPIVPVFTPGTPSAIKNKIVVYLPFESQQDIISILSGFKENEFYIYGAADHESDYENLHQRPFSRQKFIKDLMDSSGVICNAGFELPSEALQLGKKILVKPLSGQAEQLSNAKTISILKLGMTMKNFDKKIIAEWLSFSPPERQCYPDIALMIAQWIGAGNYSDMTGLSRLAWANTKLFNF